MIRPLRTRHRRQWLLLGLLLPLLYLLALVVRPTPPTMQSLPEALQPYSAESTE